MNTLYYNLSHHCYYHEPYLLTNGAAYPEEGESYLNLNLGPNGPMPTELSVLCEGRSHAHHYGIMGNILRGLHRPSFEMY